MTKRQILAVVGLAFLIGYAFTALLLFPGWGRGTIVAVPDVRGRSFAQAERRIERAGLVLERGTTLVHPTVPRGAVLAQVPLPGQETSRGDAVRITLSAGPDRRAVPDVSMLTGEQAHLALARTGYQVEVQTVPDNRPAGRVVAVQPAAGTVLPVAGRVLLQLSAGPPPPAPDTTHREQARPEPEPEPEEADTGLAAPPDTVP